MTQEITTIRFLDVESDKETTVSIQAGGEYVLLFLCHTNIWDEEVFLSTEHCKSLADALKHALEELEQDKGDSLETPARRDVSGGNRERIIAKEIATIRFPNIETDRDATIVVSTVGRKVALRANPDEYEGIEVHLDIKRCKNLIEALEQAQVILKAAR